MTKVLLIRHATNDTVGKRLAGRMSSISLNEEGKKQAQELAERLKHLPIAAIYSSPLERATETAEPLATLLDLPVNIYEDVTEINFGEWTGMSFDELAGKKEFQLFNTLRSCSAIPGGETMIEAQARAVNGINKLCTLHRHDTIAIVSHADIIKAAIAYYSGIHLDLFQRIEISPASVSIVELEEDWIKITLMNHCGGIKI